MQQFKILNSFFQKISKEQSITTSHVSIYAVLFIQWCDNRYGNPIQITRADIMNKAKISSKATYHKCMRELHTLGFIKYDPSYHPHQGSSVHLLLPFK